MAETPDEQLLAEYRQLLERRLEHVVQVDQPIALITQMARSGGTLMMRLLDGHPEVHSIPHEFGTDFGVAGSLLGPPEAVWPHLFDSKVELYLEAGYRHSRPKLNRDTTKFPLLVSTSLQREIFDRALSQTAEVSERMVVDAYLTSYFNAWLDNQNLYAVGAKRWVSAFVPQFLTIDGKINRFNELYPDGAIISIIRDPRSWFASARRWSARWRRLDVALAAWTEAAEATIALKARFGDRVHVIAFEDLVARPDTTMLRLSRHLGISWSETLLRPTFNGLPILANSSFRVKKTAINAAPLERYKTELDEEEIRQIGRHALPLYREVAALRLVKTGREPRKKGSKAGV